MTDTARGEPTVEEPPRHRAAVARRVAEARATVPEHVLEVEADLEEAVGLIADGAHAPATVVDLVVRACALTLREQPQVNAAYRDARYERLPRVNVGVVVEGPAGLLVPTLFDADERPLADLARESARLAERARAGEATAPELRGQTFTVLDLGAAGVRRGAAVLLPPQAATLAIGAVARRPVVHGNAVVARHTAALTLSADHRILHPGEAGRFLVRVAERLLAPAELA